ncbi:hypothetical protein [Anaerotignum sp. MB30-C6]|uniref:hypothetical protein n=1 Tax=Anaerotignum sp. MB30-C6 TaxID=3070814 RepID=UPI0027DDA56F|nr:hypothetical protein [Anaerotignum sp. MB30-C6]WMI81713.1 hypothetical protein RBQ60_02945 [Anaerotignum sp. MB30-C6]
MKEYVIHSLSIWLKEEIKRKETVFLDMMKEDVLEYHLSDFTMVQVHFSMAHSQLSLEKGL